MIFISLLIYIVALALPFFNRTISSILFVRMTSIIFLYAGVLSLNTLYIQLIGSGIGVYNGLFQVTVISHFIEIFILFMAFLLLMAWPSTEKSLSETAMTIGNYPKEYSLIALLSVLGQILLLSSSDLISFYLSIELQSFGVYILASIYRNSELAVSAGLKYFLLGGFSSCLILLGCALVYTFTGLTQLESIYLLISISDSNTIFQGLSLGIFLIIVGLLFKIAAAPLHNWAPDVYSDSPTIVTVWLTIMPKISILIFMLDLLSQLGILENFGFFSNILDINNQTTIYILTHLLLISSLLSLLIGSIVGLAQTKIKRLLAYSTISHVGFILLALSINTQQSIEAFLFYIIQYSLTNFNSFLILISFGFILKSTPKLLEKTENMKDQKEIGGSENDLNYISELSSAFWSNPLLALSLCICLFSMAGIPPLIGFFSKQFVLFSALQNGYYFMAIISILVSIISASYYLKIIRTLFIESKTVEGHSIENSYIMNDFISYLISILTLFILFFICYPSILLNSIKLLSLSLYQF